MKALVFLIIAGIAGLIGYRVLTPQCAGGAVVTSAAVCESTAGFTRAFCQQAFAQEETAIRNAGTLFADQQTCSEKFLICMPFPGGVHGWTPKPSGYCLVRGADGAIARMTPVYANP